MHAAIGGAILFALALVLGAFPAKAEERIIGQTYLLGGIDCGEKADVPRAVALVFANDNVTDLVADIKANKLSCERHTLAMVWLGPTGEQFQVEDSTFDVMAYRVPATGEMRYSWRRVEPVGESI